MTTLNDYIGADTVAAKRTPNPTIDEGDEDIDTTETSTSVVIERAEKHRIAGEIEEWVDEARELAKECGLDPYYVNYWIVDNEEMNQLITYGGFQHRFPHWRWGMIYDQQRRQNQYLGGKAYEIVNNDDPAHAFLQMSNSEAQQKMVVTHVEAHADFFKNNRWFRDSPSAAQLLSRNAERIEEIMSRPDVSRDDVESLIDTIMCIQDHIDQTQTLLQADPLEVDKRREERDEELSTMRERIVGMDVPDSIKKQFFGDDWIEEHEDEDTSEIYPDVIGYLMRHGHMYDEEAGTARPYEDWEREVIRMLREESYYFAPQRMTKIMNEGWASYWQTVMMSYEGFAGEEGFVEHADHHSLVLESPGLNPYRIGRELWEHVENQVNRDEVVDKLLRVDGITPENFLTDVDFDLVLELLEHPNAFSMAKRHFSLVRLENRGFLGRIDYDRLVELDRLIVDDEQYETIEDALLDVDYDAGWKRMREVRETHVDVTFIDEFMDDEFIEERGYFIWDHDNRDDRKKVSSLDPMDVKKKLLLNTENFGKPTIVVSSGNFNNQSELLLEHQYNGIPLDLPEAGQVLERLADIWGRAVHLLTVNRLRDGSEEGLRVFYDPDGDAGEPEVEEVPDEEIMHLLPDDGGYWTKPRNWLV